MRKLVFINFSNPNALEGERPYRAHCEFDLQNNVIVDVYKCPIVSEMQNEHVDNRVIFHASDEVFVFQTPDSAKHIYDKALFKNMCANCPNKHNER